jgi:transposase
VKRKRRQVDVNLEELDGILDRARVVPLSESECDQVKTVLHALAEQLASRFRTTEKTAAVVGGDPAVEGAPAEKLKAPGHGRNGAAALTTADRISVEHPHLSPCANCPECQNGKVYPIKEPSPLVRFVGQAPVAATVYELQRLRCNLCGEVYTAPPPEGVGPEKYDETVPSVVAGLKYGRGIPFNRIEALQRDLGIPLPASTQWDLIEDAAAMVRPAYDELIRQAAQWQVLHNDDTSMRVLNVERPEGDKRTGVFTTGLVATGPVGEDQPTIALFFTGRQHGGENLRDVLQHRAAGLGPPMQMCDALSRNQPKLSLGTEILLANCLVHGRRHFVQIADNFPDQCKHVLDMLGQVYGYEDEARDRNLDPRQRLNFHRQYSEPVMKELRCWMTEQLEQKRTEPNSGLGKAMKYLLTHWKALTLFLRAPGVPLDNNICERALKKAVLHRKNALFYRTQNGAEVGDIFMSLIHSCELNGVNSFNYLTELQRHASELREDPGAWMPWTYAAQLGRASPG